MRTEDAEHRVYECGDDPMNPAPITRLKREEDLDEEMLEKKVVGTDEVEHIVPTEEAIQEAMKQKPSCVVLFSGGLDSSAALVWAIEQGLDVHALTIDYGASNSEQEVRAARALAKKLGLDESRHVVMKLDVPFWNVGLNKKDAFKDGDDSEDEYVPARNSVFLAFAYSYAERHNLDAIVVGFNAGGDDEPSEGDGRIPDTNPLFCRAWQYVINSSTIRDEYFTIAIVAPFMKAKKSMLARYLMERGISEDETYSCYKGDPEPCGQCPSCKIRKRAYEVCKESLAMQEVA